MWTRLDTETPQAFRAFELFRDIVKGRSLRLAYAAYVEDRGQPGDGDEYREGTKQVPGSFKKWSSEHKWLTRAAAYDAHLRALAREQNERAHIDELTDYRNRVLGLARETSDAAVLALTLVNRSLRTAVAQAKKEGEEAMPIPLERVGTLMRAAAYASEVSTNAEAVALGVDDLLGQLDPNLISARKEEARERARTGRDED